ncbi:MAG: phosphopantetheine-binding protein [Planctomycetaceae bacterium]|jgi:acyl carrier protein|nr:phosphopantetheine-binding protein [Planctomycetaceae bacterium]
MTKGLVYEHVKDVLIDELAVDAEEIRPEATLIGDLGAESIDILGIVFNLEKKLGIKLERGEIVPEDVVNDKEGLYVVDNKLTELGIMEIKKRMPFANIEELEKNPMVANIKTILTVRDLCYIVESKLNADNADSDNNDSVNDSE